MILLHRIGPRHTSNWNTIDEILACNEPLSFDGIYTELLIYADQLVGKDITLFFSGAHLGKDNSFDAGERPGKFCDLPEILYLSGKLKAKLGYHSLNHLDLTAMTTAGVLKEIAPPFPMDLFAYPFGRTNARVIELIKEMGYTEAFCAGHLGDGSQYQRKRAYLNW